MFFGLLPDTQDLLVKPLVEGVSVLVGQDQTLEGFRVASWLDAGFRVSHEVVVHVHSSWLLLFDHDLSYLQEEVGHL